MEFDALEGGVYGGLVTKENIKLLICYIINNINRSLPRDEFCSEMHAEGIANYFELAEAFNDLNSKQLIVESQENKGEFDLSPTGYSTIKQLKENIPLPIRERAFYATVKMLRRFKYREQTKVEAEALGGGEYLLSCSIVEGDKEMMTIRLNVPDFETAQKAKNIFWDSPEKIQSGIIKLLTHKNIEYTEPTIEFLDK